MKGIIAGLLFAALACQAVGVGQTTAAHDGYVVFADKLNMRAAPGTSAEVVVELPRGARLIPEGENGERADGYYWRRARFDGKVGWVAASYVVPGNVYDAFASADEAGRAGDASRMMEEIRSACTESEWPEYRLNGSPDGRKVVCAAYGPALYFEAGKGLAYNLGGTWTAGGLSEWTADSRYLAYYLVPEVRSPLVVYDTKEGESIAVVSATSHDFVDGYLIWSDYEDIESPAGGPDYDGFVPVVTALELATAKEIRLLAVDLSTLRLAGGDYELKMAKVCEPPPEVAASPLYEEYAGEYVWWLSGQ
jgi:hypothetical protein